VRETQLEKGILEAMIHNDSTAPNHFRWSCLYHRLPLYLHTTNRL